MICCRPEGDDDLISGRNVKTIEGYVLLNFEIASSGSFIYFPKRSFRDGQVGDGIGGMNAICSRPEAPDDDIYGENVETFMHYRGVYL